MPVNPSTYAVFIANVNIGDFHLQVFDHLRDQFLHKGVLLFGLWIFCAKTLAG